jgi:tRNA pseudouridine55 synthase
LNEAAKARALDGAVVPLVAALDDIPALPVTPDQAQLLRHGQTLAGFPETPVALVEATAGGLKVVRGFNI